MVDHRSDELSKTPALLITMSNPPKCFIHVLKASKIIKYV